MQAIRCPHCGAPSSGSQVAPGAAFTCAFCKQTAILPGGPALSPGAQPEPQTAHILVVHSGHHEPHHEDVFYGAVRSANNMGFFIRIGVLLLFGLSSAGVGVSRCKGGSVLSSLSWNGSESLVCAGNQEISVSNVKGSFASGSAISASGNCHVTCTHCELSAPTIVDATGNARVTLTSGSALGSTLLVTATGNAVVNVAEGTQVSGEVKQFGNAKVTVPAKRAEPPPTKPPSPASSSAAIKTGSKKTK
jgi:hypothetical protein